MNLKFLCYFLVNNFYVKFIVILIFMSVEEFYLIGILYINEIMYYIVFDVFFFIYYYIFICFD